jgi:hypothetical protein
MSYLSGRGQLRKYGDSMFMFWHLEGTGLRVIEKGGLYFVIFVE